MRIANIGRSAAIVTFGLVAFSLHAHGQTMFSGQPPSFTADQAAHGKTDFDNSCAVCHGPNLDDGQFGPALKGATFRSQWKGQPSAALFSYLTTKMPPSGPGVLGNQVYADIEAYLLQSNGASAGTAELSANDLAAAALQAAGPQEAAAAAPRRPRIANEDEGYQAAMAARQALLGKMTPVTDAMLRNPPESDWLIWRRTYDNISYSPLKQIDKKNVDRLGLAWSLGLPLSGNEITPLEHDGVIFLNSGNTVLAADATNGDLLWRYIRSLPDSLNHGGLTRMKSIAIYQDKIFAPTADGHVVALDAKSGKLVWDEEVITPDQIAEGKGGGVGYHMSGGPLVAHGKVIIGVSLGVTTGGGDFIVGLDPASGKELWRFHTIARPGQPGGDSWNGAPVSQRYGGGVWTSGSYDPDLNLVYFGTGNTYDVGTLLIPQKRKGKSNDALYTDTTLALNPDTGKLVWYYQHMNRDVWDLDWVFEQSLITLPVDGAPTKLVVTGGKMAIFDAMDRATGQYAFSADAGLQNLVASIDPKTGKKIVKPEYANPEPGKTYFDCPDSNGFRNWATTSYDPVTSILYVPMIESCSDYSWVKRDAAAVAAGGQDLRSAGRPMPNNGSRYGRIEAINLKTRRIVWIDRQRAGIASSMLSTAGGLAFNGSDDRMFHAYDAANGNMLWQVRLNAVPSSSPITYSVGGVQYVAVIAGGGSLLAGGANHWTPELYNPAGTTTLWVFKLPGARR